MYRWGKGVGVGERGITTDHTRKHYHRYILSNRREGGHLSILNILLRLSESGLKYSRSSSGVIVVISMDSNFAIRAAVLLSVCSCCSVMVVVSMVVATRDSPRVFDSWRGI